MTEYSFLEFNLSEIKPTSKIVIIGKTESGKSTIIADILHSMKKKIETAMVVCSTRDGREDYEKLIPPLFIYDELSEAIIDRFITAQQNFLDVYRKNETVGALILDDCMHDSKMFKTKAMKYIYMNSRHDNVLNIVALQYCFGIGPDLRTNVDYVFILREINIANRKKLYDNYAGMFPTFEIFCKVLDFFTENYGCLVIKNKGISNKIEDQVFWFKAKIHKPFKVGSKEYRAFARKNYSKKTSDNPYTSVKDLTRKYAGQSKIFIVKK